MRQIVVLIAVALAVPATGDVVRLTNGNSFEGVVSEVTETEVTIRLDFGEMRLSRKSVERIEREESALGEILEAWDGLVAEGTAGADAWVELGRHARSQGLDSKALAAAREAAALDPEVEGLDALMSGLGHVFDDARRRWVPYDDFMHGRGFVLEHGEWISRQTLEARLREREAIDRARREAARDSRLNQVVELLALAQLQRLEEDRERPAVVAVPYGAYPTASFPGYWPGYGGGGPVVRPPVRPVPPVHYPARPVAGQHGHGAFSSYAPSSWDDVARRQPGSIIPLQPTSPPPKLSGGAQSGGSSGRR